MAPTGHHLATGWVSQALEPIKCNKIIPFPFDSVTAAWFPPSAASEKVFGMPKPVPLVHYGAWALFNALAEIRTLSMAALCRAGRVRRLCVQPDPHPAFDTRCRTHPPCWNPEQRPCNAAPVAETAGARVSPYWATSCRPGRSQRAGCEPVERL